MFVYQSPVIEIQGLKELQGVNVNPVCVYVCLCVCVFQVFSVHCIIFKYAYIYLGLC